MMKFSELNVFILYVFLTIVLEACDAVPMFTDQPHVCIIGAGYSGLGTARHMQDYGLKNVTIFEATRHIGGTWRFDPHVGVDEDGLPLFTSMYKYLRTNTPRQTMEYTGYPFPESTPSYPTGNCFYKYLKSFAKQFDIMKFVQLRSYVTSVRWNKGVWNVTYTRTDIRSEHTEICDYVVVATGYYSKPKWPKFEGQEDFEGTMIHSHDYKDPESYSGRRVLVVGAGPSGLDLATQLVNVTSKLVHSHHLRYNQPNFPNNYIKKPDIAMIDSNGVMFEDGSYEEVDVIIFCTGYEFNHPFLEENCGVTASRQFVLPLYQHMVNIRHPSMVFVGLPKGVINRVLDVQAEYAAALAAKKFTLPSSDHMLMNWLEHVRYLHSRGKKIVDVNLIGDAMDEYFANMTQEAGVTRAKPVLTKIRDFNAKNRLDDLLHYRDYDYKVIDDYRFDRFYNPRGEDVCPLYI